MEKNYRHLLLDLDGTVIDSGEGITRSVQYALISLGIEVKDRRELYPFIGPPLKDSFRQFYRLDEVQTEQAVRKYRERYEVEGWRENVVYAGIKNLLAEWRGKGKNVMLCTSKPEKFARKILKEYRLEDYFTFIGGATLDGMRNTKAEVMEYVLNSCPGTDKKDTVMIGDRKYDVIGAKEVGVDAVGVLYGYGNRQELLEAGADYLAENVEKLRKLIR